MASRNRLVVRTLRCGRSNPGTNPGPGMSFFNSFYLYFAKVLKKLPTQNILQLYLRILIKISQRHYFTLHSKRQLCSNYKILGAPIKVTHKIFCLYPVVGRMVRCDRLVVRTLRCGRSNPGLNPVPALSFLSLFYLYFSKILENCWLREIF